MSGKSRRNIILARCFISLISVNLRCTPIFYVMVVVLWLVLNMSCQIRGLINRNRNFPFECYANLYDLLLVFFLLKSYYRIIFYPQIFLCTTVCHYFSVLCLSGVSSGQCSGAAGQGQHHREVQHQTPGAEGCRCTGTQHTSVHKAWCKIIGL